MAKEDTVGAQGPVDFSLVLGGPLYQLLLRSHLTEPSLAHVQRRILAAVGITWLPIALLALAGGKFFGGVSVPFLYDVDVHVRFLIALPMLIGAELLIHRRLRVIVGQFIERDLLAPDDRPRFERIIADTMRLRNSVAIEIILLVIAFTAGYWAWRAEASLNVVSWYATSGHDVLSFTPAGYWYAFVSVPIFRFVLLRWYFRLFVWYVFLFRVSRLPLQLNPLHPDSAGGLEFLSQSLEAISPILVAQSAFLSGLIANQILNAGAALPDFKVLIASVAVFLMLLPLLPLLFFMPMLAVAKRAALREYGAFAARYTGEFRRKWLRAAEINDSELLGSADIQSLADLGNAFAVVHNMRLLPFNRNSIVRLVISIAIPLLPLALTMFPFGVIMQQLLQLLL